MAIVVFGGQARANNTRGRPQWAILSTPIWSRILVRKDCLQPARAKISAPQDTVKEKLTSIWRRGGSYFRLNFEKSQPGVSSEDALGRDANAWATLQPAQAIPYKLNQNSELNIHIPLPDYLRNFAQLQGFHWAEVCPGAPY